MSKQSNHVVFALLAAMVVTAVSAAAQADEYPSKPVRLVVGGGSDVPARVLANNLSAVWKLPMYVEPQPAAGGIVAAKTVKDAAPDGHTLLQSTGAYLLNQAARTPPPFTMGKDFVPVGLLGTAPQIVVVPPTLPVRNMGELIAYSVKNPNTAFCASAGIGGSSHLACEMLRHYGKADVQHVAYKGVSPALVDVMAGRVQVAYTAVAAIGAIKEGKLRAIAVTGPKRLNALPDVPTVSEQGHPELTLITWYGIHAPAKTPGSVVDFVNRAIAKAMQDPAVAQGMVNAGLEPETMSVQAFADFMATQEATITKLWRETGAKIE
jgi:tripartite-type tricarboxylate transporter receptor subunit TctC